ncbi:hypothetical protein [uncultured Shewanella sp.]|uniref:hypothetical protein n=1 Tax=uncultured Shewanella sp. TaxID=173975 RepID=UPI00262347FA|nr:hypothetical protein [uncultured Shewanella sp.]
MKWIYFVIFSLFSAVSYAEPLNIVGQWQGEYRIYVYHNGESHKGLASLMFTVTEQDKEFLHAKYVWQLNKANVAKPDVAGKQVKGAEEELLGIFSFNEKDITFIETEDNGVLKMTIIDNDTIQAVYHENQHHEATLYRVKLKRVK